MPRKITAHPADRADVLTERLLDVATKFFMEKGFEGASVTQIAREARASKESFYSRYPTKEELFRAVIRRRTDQMAAQAVAILSPALPPEEALTTFGEIFLERLLTGEITELRRILWTEWQRIPELVKMFYDLGPARGTLVLAKYLECQAAKGTLAPLDSQLAARQFTDLLAAELITRAAYGIFPEPTKREKKKKVQDSVDFFLRAYQPGKRASQQASLRSSQRASLRNG
ncbi:TetR/AcrR family transcriptional regulator [Granulicella sp. WH15]|uniref:TetR/AcrR family transcriptional regulator n=1 Tax=Granulicella sp. WH15 TaxID=2602070 RepID=UPI0013677FF4|nr:TetR/AcrR family transcriptional regulator [Granulicella sp. WH15]QHN02788.1 TetR/AcrR family transcriptional regulator [Granulicella sp. WH15]